MAVIVIELAGEQILGALVLAFCVGWFLADLSSPGRRRGKPPRRRGTSAQP